MRKLLLILCLLLVTTMVNAQFYVGGSVGFGLVKKYGNETETTFKIIPELGYAINNNWAVGLSFGYKKGSCLVGKSYYDQNIKSKAIGIQPYIRYIPFHISIVDLFVDGCLTYESIIDEGKNYNAGFRPGLSIKPIEHLSIIAQFGFLGVEYYKSKYDDYKNGIAGLDVDASNLTIGATFSF